MNSSLFDLIRPHYRALKGYVSAGMESDKTADLIFLNANENPYELDGLEGLNRYPEPQPKALLAAYAAAYGCAAENIVATRGADEAIVILSKLFCEPHQDRILICPPTFGMYSVNANTMPAGIVEVPLLKQGNDFSLDVERIVATEAKLIFICSPNNPTGTPIPPEDIAHICRAVEGRSVVALDETYAEFARDTRSMVSDIDAHPNLIILRTLSKSYSLAGMRMGCLISGDRDLMQLMRSKCLDAYPLPLESVAAAMTALSQENREKAAKHINLLLAERKRMEERLAEMEIVKTIYKSDANFLLLQMDRAAEFIAFCKEQRVILRDFSNKPMTEDCIRISIGTPEQNDLVLKLFEEFS